MYLTLKNLIIILIQMANIESKLDLCLNCSDISGIAFIDSMRMKWALSKSQYYWLLKDNELPTSETALELPIHFSSCDAIAVKDLFECLNPEDDEFSIIFVQLIDKRLQFISYNIESGNMSEPKDLKNDIVFGNADIDYTEKLDAMFNGISGQIFLIQGLLNYTNKS
jgi:hypothetical protein